MNLSLKLAAAAICTLLVASCSSQESKAQKEFVNSCRSQGGPKDQCLCVYDKLSNHYGAQVMVMMQEQGLPADDFGEAVITAALQCKAGDTTSGIAISSERRGAESPARQPESRAPNESDLDSAIAARAAELSGEEYRSGRQVRVDDVTGDGIPDQISLFTIEVPSHNTYTQFLVVIASRVGEGPFETDSIVVGGPGQRVDAMHVAGGEIKLEIVSVGPDDPECCPSVASSVEYLWHKGKIKRLD